MTEKDKEKMIRLAKEGKAISKIHTEDFSGYDYWHIYFEIYDEGERSSLGIRRMITNRLNLLAKIEKKEQDEIIEEINDLIRSLYDRHRANQQKLDDIRSIITS